MKQKEYILIEHIGVIDKPIKEIKISTLVCNNFDKTENYLVVNPKDYKEIKEIVLANFKNEYLGNEFGSFRITLNKSNGETVSHCLDRKNSIDLLKKMITHSKKSNIKDLLLALETVNKRITY